MAEVEILMPKMGESIMEATILGWLKSEGDTIEQDESLLEVATDKVDTEVPSTHGGVVKKILANEGDVVEVGKPIALVTVEVGHENGASVESVSKDAIKEEITEAKEAETSVVANTQSTSKVAAIKNSSGRFYSPLVKNIAQKEGISQAELDNIQGTGKEGRVSKKDILSYLENRPSNSGSNSSQQASIAAPQTMPVQVEGSDEIIEMDRMRKMIATRMVDSKRISPHVTSFVEADVTGIVKWRNRNKTIFMDREGEPLTFTPLFIEAVVKAILDYPNINVQVDGNRIIKKKSINIGMAVALPSGNLIVPVIHNAERYSLTGLAKKVNDLARRARSNQLKPDELAGGTYTISNVGSFGNVMGTPIIMQPQVGILALGAIQKKPSVIETSEGDSIAIRSKMFLSHSYDHRVVDGALGGMMVRRVADYLEKFDYKRTI